MLKIHSSRFSKIDRLTDLLLTVGSFFLSYFLAKWLSPHLFIEQLGSLNAYIWMLCIVIPIWLIMLPRYGLYGSLREISVYRLIYITCMPVIQAGVLSGAVVFLLKQQSLSRGFFLTFLLLNLFTLVIWKLIVRQSLWYLRKQGYNYRRILIIGDFENAKSTKANLEKRKEWGLQVVGMVNLDHKRQCFVGMLEGKSFFGDLGSMQEILLGNVVDEILITSLNNKHQLIQEVVSVAEEIGVRVRVVLDLFPSKIFKSTAIERLGGNYALTLHTTQLDTRMAVIKRTMDIFISVFGIILTGIISIPIAILIKCTSKGPVFVSPKTSRAERQDVLYLQIQNDACKCRRTKKRPFGPE